MARRLTARGVSAEAVAHAAAEAAAGQGVKPGARQHTAALVRLTDIGAATWRADGEVHWTGAMSVAAALRASEAETEREGEVDRSRLRMMRNYAEHTALPGARSCSLTLGKTIQVPAATATTTSLIPRPRRWTSRLPWARES